MNKQGERKEKQEQTAQHQETERPPMLALLPVLGVLSQLFQSRMEALLQPSGLTYTQLAVLSHLDRETDGQSISALAAAFEIKQPGMSKVVQKLEAAESIATRPDADDPRRKLCAITNAGRRRFIEAGIAMSADVDRWFIDWSDDELAAFAQSAQKLVGWLDENRVG